MKKLVLSVALMAFAIAAQAGDAKSSTDKSAAPCCSKMKVSSEQAKAACCSDAKGAMCKAPGKQALLSPKAAAEIGR